MPRRTPKPRATAEQTGTPKKGPKWVRAFLASFAETGNVRLACQAAKVGRTTAYTRRKSDPIFAAAWDAAQEDAADRLEQEAVRRAHDGVRRLKFHQGEPILVQAHGRDGKPLVAPDGTPVLVPYVEHEYSDTLLIFLLKGVRPEKYRERQDVQLSGGTTLEIVEEIVDAPPPPGP